MAAFIVEALRLDWTGTPRFTAAPGTAKVSVWVSVWLP
jgi:hypothetical protein